MKEKSQSEVVQSCPTLSDPMDCSTPGSSIHGIFQARVLEWVPLMVIIAVIPEGYGNMKYLKLCIKLLANGLAAVKSDAG